MPVAVRRPWESPTPPTTSTVNPPRQPSTLTAPDMLTYHVPFTPDRRVTTREPLIRHSTRRLKLRPSSTRRRSRSDGSVPTSRQSLGGFPTFCRGGACFCQISPKMGQLKKFRRHEHLQGGIALYRCRRIYERKKWKRNFLVGNNIERCFGGVSS